MKTCKKIFKIIGITLGVLLLLVIAFFGVLTVTEFKPGDKDPLTVSGNASGTLQAGDTISVLTWNIGYGALGDNADFFMDGGSSVYTADEDRVTENINAIRGNLGAWQPDVIFLQEVDENSSRSYHTDETAQIAETMSDYSHAFAYNFKTLYVPYPMPPIGQVNSGIMTLNRFTMEDACRVKLPCPFSYPVRLCNLKRCLLVSRVPIEGSDKELVLINLHLEAYDDGEGKIEQTKILKNILEEEAAAGNYVIAGGDFNQSFSSIDTSAYASISEDLWQCGLIDVAEFDPSLQFIADNRTPSCRSLDQAIEGADLDHFQFYLIDGFIVSDNLLVNDYETLDLGFKNTDHNPVLMNVTLQ